jgi:uncharacterized protein (TIGR02453 family)
MDISPETKLIRFIPHTALDFLKLLKQNNNREWFLEHKAQYNEQYALIEGFADELLTGLHLHDLVETPSGKKSLQRIYRDTRFSKEKIPYKNHWAGSFRRATKQRRGGYYFHIEPGNTFVGGGFQAPNPQDLKRIREELSSDPAPLRKILSTPLFIDTFGTLLGDQVTTAPKGFSIDNEAIDLLRFKQFLLIKRFTDDEVFNPLFSQQVGQVFRNMRPFFDYMSEVLTSDINGVKL